jgi:acyl carrier protein
MSSIQDRVIKIVEEQLGIDEVIPKHSFAKDLEADSLDATGLIMAFEEEFELEIPDEQGSNMPTVQSVVDYIGARL